MKYSLWLLKKYISINDTAESIANNLILKTCEIEEIVTRTIPESIVIGYVTDVQDHPDADKLVVCQVDCGSHWDFQIITGGENVVTGSFVPIALPWTYMEKLGFTIELRKMRWLESNGMICSKWELGIDEDEDKHRIWVLNEDIDDLQKSDAGTPLAKKYPWLENTVLDVDNKSITHRPDLNGHFGIGVELQAMYGKDTIISNDVPRIMDLFATRDIVEHIQEMPHPATDVIVKSAGVRSYVLAEVKDISVKPSSLFTRLQCYDLGLGIKNNWVDFSNLFMYMTGQPVHFFDADVVQGTIIVREATNGEQFIDLFDDEHILTDKDIVIADDEKILALAGIVWAKGTWVSKSTKNILVEIANFDPVQVRRTWTRLGLRTDAELRFEKNINPLYSSYTLLFLLDLLQYFSKDLREYTVGGSSLYHDNLTQELAASLPAISMDNNYVATVLGMQVDEIPSLMQSILPWLWFTVQWSTVIVPVWRWTQDINIQEDVIEELARMYGYDRFASSTIMQESKSITPRYEVKRRKTLEEVSSHSLTADQLETYPWVSDQMLSIRGQNTDDLYTLINGASGQKFLRNDLVYNLLSSVSKNAKFFDGFGLFDIGTVRDKTFDKDTKESNYARDLVKERVQYGALFYYKQGNVWLKDTVLFAKSAVQRLVEECGIGTSSLDFVPTDIIHYHPKKQAHILSGDTIIGFIGSVHPQLLKQLKLPETADVVYISLWQDAMQEATLLKKNGYETLQDQIVYRDLSFVVDKDLSRETLLDPIRAVENVVSVDVFDLYSWERISAGKKSVALTLKIYGENMTTEDINTVMNKAIKAWEQAGGVLRDG